MRSVADYLGVTVHEARSQWRGILARRPVVAGVRQVDFVPVETLICLAASLVVNHRVYGGSTSNRAEQPVPSLARLFQRPNSSVLAKMANLDGSRTNGAKHEVEMADRVLNTAGQLASLYRLVVRAAREVGIDAADLPDFLLLEHDDSDLLLLGQEELGQQDVEQSVQGAATRWSEQRGDLDDRLTERLLVAAARVGQHRFAGGVLRNHGHRCVFCGLSVDSGGQRASRMLVASHIKPWRSSSNVERLDVRNGLAACPTHDVAFDTGLLMVNGGLRIHVAPHIEAAAVSDPATRAAFGRPPLADRLLLPDMASPPGPIYLDWHRANIFQPGAGPSISLPVGPDMPTGMK